MKETRKDSLKESRENFQEEPLRNLWRYSRINLWCYLEGNIWRNSWRTFIFSGLQKETKVCQEFRRVFPSRLHQRLILEYLHRFLRIASRIPLQNLGGTSGRISISTQGEILNEPLRKTSEPFCKPDRNSGRNSPKFTWRNAKMSSGNRGKNFKLISETLRSANFQRKVLGSERNPRTIFRTNFN